MRTFTIGLLGVFACGAPEPRAPAVANECAVSPTTPALTQAQLELRRTAPDLETSQRQLVGIWDGNDFDIDGELGMLGKVPRPGPARVACFGGDGALTTHIVDEVPRTGTGCRERTRTYTLHREPEADNMLVLDVMLSGGCPADAGYDKPYKLIYEVSRLDDEHLVLIDGSTAAVQGYRRRVSGR